MRLSKVEASPMFRRRQKLNCFLCFEGTDLRSYLTVKTCFVRTSSRWWPNLVLCILAFNPLVLAQDSSSILSGRVFDKQGAEIPGAIVNVKNTETGLQRQANCDGAGYYRIVGLPPGRYEARGAHHGFSEEIRTGLVLTVAEDLVVNFRLTISPLTEQVFVNESRGV